MGIDLATWRARIGLNHYRQCQYACRSLPVQWKAARWGVKEAVNSTPLVFQGCMAVVSLSLILEYAFRRCRCPKATSGCGSKLRSGSLHSHSGEARRGTTVGVGGGVSLLLQVCVVVLALLLMAGDVERNPGPTEKEDQVDKLLSTVDDSPLGEENLADVLEQMVSVSASWYAIGIRLGLGTGILDQFTGKVPRDCMIVVLTNWLNKNYIVEQFGEPTWKTVVEVVANPAAGNNFALASRIAGKHPVVAAATPQTCREDSSNSTVSDDTFTSEGAIVSARPSSSIESEGCQVPNTKEPHQAESVSVTKVMEEMARKTKEIARNSKEIEQLQMQLKMELEEREHKNKDLKAQQSQLLKEQLVQENEPQPTDQAESLFALKEDIARKNREIGQLQMEIEKHKRKIKDLEAENHVLKQQLEESWVKTGEDKAVPEKKRKATTSVAPPSKRHKHDEGKHSVEHFEQQEAEVAAKETALEEVAATKEDPMELEPASKMPEEGGTSGGYDCEFIRPPPSVYQTTCPICRLILRDPYEATCCAYSFCYTCSQHVERNNSPCPWCRKEKFEVKENKGMRRSLNQLEVYCTYGIDGCTWRGELGELQAHLDKTDHSEYERPTYKSPPCQQDSKSKMEWKRKKDIPLAMNAHHIVRIGNSVYCGGGFTGKVSADRLVFKYNCKEQEWLQLPVCPTLHFGLTQLDEKLVTVGGRDIGELTPIKDVYIFEEDSQEWNNLPSLSEARCSPCAFAYKSKSVLVAAGGINRWKIDYEHSDRTNSVEVFQNSQWHASLPLPFALSAMSCAVVNDTCYIVGGSKSGGLPNRQICFVSIPSLLPTDTDHPQSSKATTSSPKWERCNCPLFFSTPAEQGGNLLAIGGKDNSNKPSSAVHKYLPSTDSWETIANGTLPETNFRAAAVSLEGGDIIIVGGRDKPGSTITTVYIASKPIEQ